MSCAAMTSNLKGLACSKGADYDRRVLLSKIVAVAQQLLVALAIAFSASNHMRVNAEKSDFPICVLHRNHQPWKEMLFSSQGNERLTSKSFYWRALKSVNRCNQNRHNDV